MSEAIGVVETSRVRLWADRPSPAIPLLLLSAVVAGGIVLTFVEGDPYGFYFNDPARLAYWVIASALAYVVMVLVARRQGYRRGIWVDRRQLAMAGLVALLAAVVTVLGWFAPLDLLIRGNVPVLALAVGVLVWAYRERRLSLWVVAIVLIPLSLLANLYNMENLLYRLGMPVFGYADQVVNLGVVAVVLLVAAVAFGLAHLFAVVRARRLR